ncbi:MAG: MBL fold metallo-hydrolase [Bacteroidales bacterium]|nr:MBL fold metallo-hydrolase [Bacteroidales bacterium]
MIKTERLIFNPFQVNTYLLYDESRETILIDPGCYDDFEKQKLAEFIEEQNLNLVAQIFTHTHIDHILGASFVFQKYGLKPVMHKDALPFLEGAKKQGLMYGFEVDEIVKPEKFIDESDSIDFGNSSLQILHTPGHVDGHLCFVSSSNKFVIVGDVLFRDSIGRTDLPTGNFDVLAHHIRNKIYKLGSDYTVFPGHGPQTTIGYEIMNNPFVNGR